MPVSYTHLDVYKRQEYAEALKEEKKQTEPEKKPSIRAQLKAAKEQTTKKQARQKTQDLERS